MRPNVIAGAKNCHNFIRLHGQFSSYARSDPFTFFDVGGTIIFARPLNGGDPYKVAPWSALVGLNIQSVRPINFAGDTRQYALPNRNIDDDRIENDDIICCYVPHSFIKGYLRVSNWNSANIFS